MNSRQAWDELRRQFPRVEPEFVRGLNELVGRFDVGDRANRFIIGGVVEYLLAACFFGLGIFVVPRGHNQNAFDLETLVRELQAKFSIKSTFSSTAGDFRLMNRLSGERAWEWTEPTIFVVRRLGLVYADPTTHLHLAHSVRDAGDAFTISLRAIRDHADTHPHCVIRCDVPVNPRTGTESGAKALFREIFDHPAYPTIRGLLHRERLNVEGASIIEHIDDVTARQARGELTAEQAQHLIDAFIERIR